MQMHLAAPTTDEVIRDRARFPHERSRIYLRSDGGVPDGLTEKLGLANAIPLINFARTFKRDTRLLAQ